jgi:predicted  nucleic acid-binding Zn-ribbon protein
MAENSATPPKTPPTLSDVLHRLANFAAKIAETLASARKDIEQLKAKDVDQESAIKSLKDRIEALEAKTRDVRR